MLLVFNRTRTYSLIAQNIIEVAAIFRIQHLIGGGESAFGHGANMYVANRLNASRQIGRGLGVWLVQHALVALSRSARLIGVNARNNQQLVRNLARKLAQAARVFAHSVFVIGRAGADDHEKLVRDARKYVANLSIALGLQSLQFWCERQFFFNLRRIGQRRIHVHSHEEFLSI